MIVRLIGLATCFALAACAQLAPSPYAALGYDAPTVVSQAFQHDLAQMSRAPKSGGNTVTTLANGDAYFPVMLEAVRSAKHSITFETFVMVDSKATYDIVDALCDKAKAGVKVHVILDGVGSRKLHPDYVSVLRKCGAQVEFYRPFNYLRLHHSNNRDHRKIMVVDGKLGFTGGAGYAGVWQGDARNVGEWRDTMYQLRGPAVADLQRCFVDNWTELGHEELSGPEYFPKLTAAGRQRVQVVLGAPYERGDTLGCAYLAAIDAARERIWIEHAYFTPNKELRKAIIRARQRGVDVKVIVPNELIDTPLVRAASMTLWSDLLEAGVEIYEYQTSMMHAKLIVVDSKFAIVGSGNFDDRSFFINDEVNLHVFDGGFSREQEELFLADLAVSERMTVELSKGTWQQWPLRWFGRLVLPQL